MQSYTPSWDNILASTADHSELADTDKQKLLSFSTCLTGEFWHNIIGAPHFQGPTEYMNQFGFAARYDEYPPAINRVVGIGLELTGDDMASKEEVLSYRDELHALVQQIREELAQLEAKK